MKHKTSSQWLLLLCFVKLNASQQEPKPTDSSLASSKLQVPISHNLSDDTSDDNDDEESNDDENEQETYNDTATKKAYAEREQVIIGLMREISNHEATLELPKSALLPLTKTLINNYPVQIKKDFQKFVDLAGNARLQLKASEKTIDPESKTQIFSSAQKLVQEASKVSSKILEVSVGRDELRKNILELAENLSFKKSYNATTKALTIPARKNILRKILPIILSCLSLYKSTQEERIFSINPTLIGDRPEAEPYLLRATSFPSLNSIASHVALPLLSSFYSTEKLAQNPMSLEQNIYFGAYLAQNTKLFTKATPLLRDIIFATTPEEDALESLTVLFTSTYSVLKTLSTNGSRYFNQKSTYPFNESRIKEIEQESKLWQNKLNKKQTQEAPVQEIATSNSSLSLSPELIKSLKASITRQKQ